MINNKIKHLLKDFSPEVIVVGAGLAGSECSWQLLRRGLKVLLIEQRPQRSNEAHTGPLFGELVCSNSLKSKDPLSAPGLLKEELSKLDSLILEAAKSSEVPAGQALAVDREKFAQFITEKLEAQTNLRILREPVTHYEELCIEAAHGPIPVVLATGPLTSSDLAESLKPLLGEQLYFYDAIAPIVSGESINREIAFLQNRYDKNLSETSSSDEGDYLNCPMNKEEYFAFIEALQSAEKVQAHDFEKAIYFQGCQPIEALLERGPNTLAFGPMKPVGLIDPRTGTRPYAVVQLRKEDSEGRAWNLVGFQTKLKYPEQQRIFRMIPGLEKAEFYRLGSLHRNTFIHSPSLLKPDFSLKNKPWIYFAGQITGVEGYLESCAIGALVAVMIHVKQRGAEALPPPDTTALGAMAAAIYNGNMKNFQPMNINWGLVPLRGIDERDRQKKEKLVERAQRQFNHWLAFVN